MQRRVFSARKQGGVLTFAKPASWHTPDRATTCDTSRYGAAEALAWHRTHPRLTPAAPGSTAAVNSR
jgi:hypothetical protein